MGADNVGGVESVALNATLNWGTQDLGNLSAAFSVVDETTGTTLAPLDSIGQAAGGTTVSVWLPVVDGHAYSWTVAQTDGTSWSAPVGPCDFVVDDTAPTNPTVSSTDFPTAGGGLESGEPGSFTLSSSDPAPATGESSGLKGYAYWFDEGAPSAVTAPNSSAGSLTLSNESFAWGEHTLYAQAVDNAGNDSAVSQYSFYVAQNPELSPQLSLTAKGALTVSADGSASTGLLKITQCSFGFGDQSSPLTGSTCTAQHTYAKPGTYPVTLTITDQNGDQKSVTDDFTTTGSAYTPLSPTRILDTRNGTGAPKAKVPVNSSITVKVAGVDSIPADVTAVVLNLTVTDATGNGFLGVVPAGQGASTATSNLNYAAGQTVANSVIVPVSGGDISVYNSGPSGTADVIADVSGYFSQSTGNGYTATSLARVLDTRNGTGAPKAKVAANSGVPVTIAGAGSIPTGVTAVAVHVTVVDTTGNGWIAAEPDGAGVPGTSTLNYGKGQIVSNTVIVPVAADGKIELYNGGGTTSVDLVADVAGYFSATSAAAYVPIDPFRIWDSRQDAGSLPANGSQTYELDIPSCAPYTIPAGSSVITNITLTDETANGFITAYPYGTAKPATSNLNYAKNQTLGGLSILNTTGTENEISVYNDSSGTSDIILDVFGYFANS